MARHMTADHVMRVQVPPSPPITNSVLVSRRLVVKMGRERGTVG